MTRVSGLVITLNEAKNITDCINSLKRVCDDIVIVDSGSTDGTIEMAREMGATVVVQKPFLGDGVQRNFGFPYCKNRWVLNLDADERVEDDLADYMNKTDLDSLGVDIVEIRRRNLLGGRFTRFAGQYPDYVKRLFNREKGEFLDVVTHTYFNAKTSIRINAHITHYSYSDYADLMGKSKYSAWLAKDLAESGKPLHAWQPALHGGWTFIRNYLMKGGFLAGLDGLTISLFKAMGSYMKYAHAIELRRNEKKK